MLIDAEETWITDPVDALTTLMMDHFNKTKAVVFNTAQLYRHDRLQFLRDCHEAAVQRNFILGMKLVRCLYGKGTQPCGRTWVSITHSAR